MDAKELDRRAFLTTIGQQAGCACVAAGIVGLFPELCSAGPEPAWTREIDHYERLPGQRIQCFVCPLHCTLEDGQTCFCRTRTNVGGKLFTRAYNNPCILDVDPIEKLPLNHFRPGSQTLTIGVGGCNVRCVYCQNWEQSQRMPDELKTYELSPRQAVASARKRGLDTIAFSYTEPVAFLEYALDVAIAAKRAGLKVVVATAAFVDPGPLLEFAKHVDAFTVALKGFDEEFYHRALGISLAPVLTAIQALHDKTDCWLELVNLVVPTYNDDPESIGKMAAWVREHVGADVPLHFERFVPMYKLTNLPRTSVQTLEAACSAARQAGLRYAYTSNIAPHQDTNTRCHECGHALIQRLGFKILQNDLDRGQCPSCRARVPGIWR